MGLHAAVLGDVLLVTLSKTYSRLCIHSTDSPIEYNEQTAPCNRAVKTTFLLPFLQGYAWCRRHHVGWYSIRKPAAGGNFFELYQPKDGMGITFFDDGNAMGWET